jgi:RimJ/RimL family protein N-acetyltransferase
MTHLDTVAGSISLRAFVETDFATLVQWIDSREALVQWAGPVQFHYPLSEDQLAPYIAGSRGEQCKRRIFVPIDEHGTSCGHIELGAIDSFNQTATLCRVMIAPEMRGKGLCAPIVRMVLRVGFAELSLRRIDLRVYGFNTPGIRCYEKAGFVKEGLLRKSQKVGERYWDTVMMAILREEWNDAGPA